MDHEARFTVPTDIRAPVLARIEVVSLVVAWGIDVSLEAVTLLTTELVANAVRHGLPPVSVRVEADGALLRLEVHDASAMEPRPRAVDPDEDAGRGLAIVDEAASRWGCRRVPGSGKYVWAELPIHDV